MRFNKNLKIGLFLWKMTWLKEAKTIFLRPLSALQSTILTLKIVLPRLKIYQKSAFSISQIMHIAKARLNAK